MHWLDLLRWHQWPKNLFVFAGLIFARRAADPGAWRAALLAALLFCLASSLGYLFNDLCDLEQDRRHPVKRRRPLAAGRIPPAAARGLLLAGLPLLAGASAWLAPELLPVLGAYLLLQLAYSLGLKRVILLDLFVIATGFVLRILAGTVAVGVPASSWVLLCGGTLALFLAAAKRRTEIADDEAGRLRGYHPAFLDQALTILAVASLVFYGLYCSELNTARPGGRDLLWTLPFVVYGLLRYVWLVERNHGSGRGLLLDGPLLVSAAAWLGSVLWLLR
jgi:4-hydroxybenzoate polyprenyltransferase